MATAKPDARRGGAAKLTVVGAGMVGSAAAYSVMVRGLVSEIVLLDLNRERAEGEAMDINHALPFGKPTAIRAGDYADAAGSDIVVLAAGVAQKPGESRLALAKTNVAITQDIVAKLEAVAPEAVLLVVANPVDVLTYAAAKGSAYPPERVIGSGTILDTARLRFELGQHCGVDPRNIHAYILGEHGDSEVPAWSLANVAGVRLRDYCPLCGRGCDQRELDRLFENARTAAYRIIELKGATYYAIALGVARLVEAVLRDEHAVFTVSTLLDGTCGIADVCLSVPAILHRGGVERLIPLQLDPAEEAALRRSADTLKTVLRSVGLQS